MIPPRSPVHVLLDDNAQWAHALDDAEPGFFARSALGQSPKVSLIVPQRPHADIPQVLWIGCADSRVPESVITGARPGDIFVHRNVANQVHPDDDSAQAVLTYGVETVGVEHVVLAGHTRCGGAEACYQSARSSADTPSTPLSRWLTPLISLVKSLDLSNTTPASALDLIVHENVKRQVQNICDAEPIKRPGLMASRSGSTVGSTTWPRAGSRIWASPEDLRSKHEDRLEILVCTTLSESIITIR
ncbi:carbonic anhydrase [Chiua virens]|nr:carbonic anhydrase [Chiua virens]